MGEPGAGGRGGIRGQLAGQGAAPANLPRPSPIARARATAVLEALHGLLSSAEAPGLWGPEELRKELAQLEAARDGDAAWRGPGGTAGLLAYFKERLKVGVWGTWLRPKPSQMVC